RPLLPPLACLAPSAIAGRNAEPDERTDRRFVPIPVVAWRRGVRKSAWPVQPRSIVAKVIVLLWQAALYRDRTSRRRTRPVGQGRRASHPVRRRLPPGL